MVHLQGLQNLHAASSAEQAAILAANEASIAAAAANSNPEVAHKRPRLDLGHASVVPTAGSSGASGASIGQPLRIDTREAVKVRRYLLKVFFSSRKILETLSRSYFFILEALPRAREQPAAK